MNFKYITECETDIKQYGTEKKERCEKDRRCEKTSNDGKKKKQIFDVLI